MLSVLVVIFGAQFLVVTLAMHLLPARTRLDTVGIVQGDPSVVSSAQSLSRTHEILAGHTD